MAVPNAIKLFVGGIPLNFSVKDLTDTFSNYGTPLEAVILPQRGRDPGSNCGFVKYATQTEAADAIAALDGVEYPGSRDRLQVRFAEARRSQGGYQQPQQRPMTPVARTAHTPAPIAVTPTEAKLYVSGIPGSYTQSDLQQLFEQYGVVNEAVLKGKNNFTGSHETQWGFVRMADLPSAQQAIDCLNGGSFQGFPMPVEVRFADSAKRPRTEYEQPRMPPRAAPSTNVISLPTFDPRGHRLFVGDVPANATHDELTAVFSPFQGVVEASASYPQLQRSSELSGRAEAVRFAFVRVQHRAVCELIIAALNGQTVPEWGDQSITVRYAKNKGEMVDHYPCPEPKVFVGTLPKTTTESSFEELVHSYGEVARLFLNPGTAQRKDETKWGMVTYVDPHVAYIAARSLNGKVLDPTAQPLQARFADVDKRAKHDDAAPQHETSSAPAYATRGGSIALQIHGLPLAYTKHDLLSLAGRYGGVISTMIINDPSHGGSMGIGAVTFDDPSSCESARHALMGLMLEGRKLYVL